MSDKDSVIIEFKDVMNNLSKAYKQFIATNTIDKDLLENARERIQVISIATEARSSVNSMSINLVRRGKICVNS